MNVPCLVEHTPQMLQVNVRRPTGLNVCPGKSVVDDGDREPGQAKLDLFGFLSAHLQRAFIVHVSATPELDANVPEVEIAVLVIQERISSDAS